METNAIQIANVDREDGDALLVEFSDGTYARYTVDDLLELMPNRERSEE